MEELLLEIVELLRAGQDIDTVRLAAIIRKHNENIPDNSRHFAKKQLFPYYLKTKTNDRARWESWNIDDDLEKRLLAVLRVKPRRTASGVATITVITRPRPCSSACLYCPNDVRMPKSYLCAEPACQRAERNYFDPYLQVTSRMKALSEMGHATDKVELIILGGTWSDYPASFQIWFVSELFRALNDWPHVDEEAERRRAFYQEHGIANDDAALRAQTAEAQRAVNEGRQTYNQAVAQLYGEGSAWENVALTQTAGFPQLELQQHENEHAAHRVVGLVMETRPDLISPESLTLFRRLGATKVQIGVQTLDERILALNNRVATPSTVAAAFDWLRVFGFKIHTHFMVNLYGATPASDLADYRRFATETSFQPDEVKIYPCALVDATGLVSHFRDGTWAPYSEDVLVDILVQDTLATPPWMRISRMIRDISAQDIMAGNKKTNLRQMVDAAIDQRGLADDVREIRFREVGTNAPNLDDLVLSEVAYETRATSERFLQWVGPDGSIAGFLRLSLPHQNFVREHALDLPVREGEAMIREVHVYGTAARLNREGTSAQHHGLGKRLVARACEIAAAAGYARINVISSVGTREYYRHLGFYDNGLYQQMQLDAADGQGRNR